MGRWRKSNSSEEILPPLSSTRCRWSMIIPFTCYFYREVSFCVTAAQRPASHGNSGNTRTVRAFRDHAGYFVARARTHGHGQFGGKNYNGAACLVVLFCASNDLSSESMGSNGKAGLQFALYTSRTFSSECPCILPHPLGRNNVAREERKGSKWECVCLKIGKSKIERLHVGDGTPWACNGFHTSTSGRILGRAEVRKTHTYW